MLAGVAQSVCYGAGSSGDRIPAAAIDFHVLQIVPIGSGAKERSEREKCGGHSTIKLTSHFS